MDLAQIPCGKDVPNDFNVVIEIPAFSTPVKYEVDKKSGALFVDRFMPTCMQYPCNYGFIPNTLSEDGDPLDVLVATPFPVVNGAVIRCRPIGLLEMVDESGTDAKIIAVPVTKLCAQYSKVEKVEDISSLLKDQIRHFFEHYKDLEPGKWVKVEGWRDVAAAKEVIMASVNSFKG